MDSLAADAGPPTTRTRVAKWLANDRSGFCVASVPKSATRFGNVMTLAKARSIASPSPVSGAIIAAASTVEPDSRNRRSGTALRLSDDRKAAKHCS